MAEIFDCYMRQRIVDVALGRRQIKKIFMDTLPLDTVKPLGGGIYHVQSESDSEQVYEVDLNIGICTCIKGNNGAVCKHQVACANHGMTVLPQMLVLNSSTRHWLAVLALGEEKAPTESFFKCLKEEQKEAQSGEGTEENKESDNERNSFPDSVEPMKMETPDVMSASTTDEVHAESKELILQSRGAFEILMEKCTKYGDADTLLAIKKFKERLCSVKSTNQLNSFFYATGSSMKKGAGRGKIPCQPTSIARRSPGMPRGSATIGKGRRPSTLASRSKRLHNLAHNVKSNVANAKAHGTGH